MVSHHGAPQIGQDRYCESSQKRKRVGGGVSVCYGQNGLLVSLLWSKWIVGVCCGQNGLLCLMVKMDCWCFCYGQSGLLVSQLWPEWIVSVSVMDRMNCWCLCLSWS